jgi:hypothetical protein
MDGCKLFVAVLSRCVLLHKLLSGLLALTSMCGLLAHPLSLFMCCLWLLVLLLLLQVSGLHELLSGESDKELAALAEEELGGLQQQVSPAAAATAAGAAVLAETP